jgi:hypothetical protein
VFPLVGDNRDRLFVVASQHTNIGPILGDLAVYPRGSAVFIIRLIASPILTQVLYLCKLYFELKFNKQKFILDNAQRHRHEG